MTGEAATRAALQHTNTMATASPSKHRLADGIFLVYFPSQYSLAATMLRFQEYHESARFHGRVFTLEDYMDWYAERFGRFSYFEDWAGFNVPSTVLTPFAAGRFDPLSRKERMLLRLFARERNPFYLVAMADDRVLRHELAHALFFTRPAYRRAVRQAVRGYDTTRAAAHLRARGYHRSVIVDEIHAYLVDGADVADLRLAALRPLHHRLHKLYVEHAAAAGLTSDRPRARRRS